MTGLQSFWSRHRTSRSLLPQPAKQRRPSQGVGSRDRRRFRLEPLEARVLLAADLALEKDDGGIRTAPGETIPYTLTYANRGDEPSRGALIFEKVPEFTHFNAAESNDRWRCSEERLHGTVCTIEVGPLDAGQSDSVVFAVTVAEHLPERLREIRNTAHIRGANDNHSDPNPRNNFAHDTTPIGHPEGRPDLVLEKSDGDESVAPGGTVVYTLHYGNTGNVGASGVVLTDRLPAHTRLNAEASSDGWHCDDRRVCQLEVGQLPAEQRGTATLAVTVNEELPPRLRAITNVAHIRDDGSHGRDPTPRNNFAAERTPVVRPIVDLRLHKDDGLRWAAPGETLRYELVYANTGTVAATGVVITERVPLHTRFIADASSEGWRCNDDGLCRLEVGELPADRRGDAVFAVRVREELPHRFVAIVNVAEIHDDGSSGADPTPRNNHGVDVTLVFSGPDRDPGGENDRPGERDRRLIGDLSGPRPAAVNDVALAAVDAELQAGRRLTRDLRAVVGDIARRLPSRDHGPAAIDVPQPHALDNELF